MIYVIVLLVECALNGVDSDFGCGLLYINFEIAVPPPSTTGPAVGINLFGKYV